MPFSKGERLASPTSGREEVNLKWSHGIQQLVSAVEPKLKSSYLLSGTPHVGVWGPIPWSHYISLYVLPKAGDSHRADTLVHGGCAKSLVAPVVDPYGFRHPAK